MTVAARERRRHRAVHGEPRSRRRRSATCIRSTTNRRKTAACVPASRGNMHLPLKRIFDEKRRLVIPRARGPRAERRAVRGRRLSARRARAQRPRHAQQRPSSSCRRPQRDDADARGMTQGRDRTDTALKAFYKDVLPSSHAQARQATFLRLTQLAEQHNLEQSRRSTDPEAGQRVVARAHADLDDAAGQLRRHPPLHPSGRDRAPTSS